jgi:hypothetical protein
MKKCKTCLILNLNMLEGRKGETLTLPSNIIDNVF